MDPRPFARANFFDGKKHPTERIYPAWTSEGIIGPLAMMESALFLLKGWQRFAEKWAAWGWGRVNWEAEPPYSEE
jgi:hypothetical protein